MTDQAGPSTALAAGDQHPAAGASQLHGATSVRQLQVDHSTFDGHNKYLKRRGIKIEDINMETLLPQLMAFPPNPPPVQPLSDEEYNKRIRAVVVTLSQTAAKKLTGGVTGGGDLLEIIDPAVNSVFYLFVLVAHINGAQTGKLLGGTVNKAILPAGTTATGSATAPGRLWASIVKFVTQFDPVQVRYAGHEFSQLLAALEQSARQSNISSEPIELMVSAMLRLDPTGSCFTSNHLNIVRVALEARAWDAVKPLLDHDIYSFPYDPYDKENAAYKSMHPYLCSHHESSSTFLTHAFGFTVKLDYKDPLQYFLLGGMLYTGLKDWERALHFYELAIITPINQKISKIQLEAYKKRVLVGILEYGGPLPMPKTTSPVAAKAYRALAKAYDTIAEIFQEGIVNEIDAGRLVAEADAGQAVWRDDLNEGLMRQVIKAFRRFSVLQLGKVYVRMLVSDVARRTSTTPSDHAETATYLKSLIASGQLKGTVTEKGNDWVLKFLEESDEDFSEEEHLQEIKDAKAKIGELKSRMSEADHKMALSKEFLEWSKKVAGQKGASGVGAEHMGDDVMTLDEDMMVDS